MDLARYPPTITLTEEQKAEVQATMEAYATAYRKKDTKQFKEIFSPDICGFGSGADEIVDGYSGFIRQISRDESQAAETHPAGFISKLFEDRDLKIAIEIALRKK